ncbi:MAG: peptide chain release factor N(5)-glutamine methyltransferase [Steroidobacteraceae bacterium]|nr:peptide chain release factor N(5)-glutamine methyltransferase [Steroidobacteraceae bacterium]
MTTNLTTGALLERAVSQLRAAGSENPALDAELLLAHVLGCPRARLKSHPEEVPPAAATQRFEALLARRAAGEPIAYLLGYRDFWTLRLKVSPAVLVPRPETELLVERALALRPQAQGRVLDLGTGSGAIALALASERPHWNVTGTDTSEEALAVARENAQAHGLTRVQFLRGSWFEPVGEQRFHLVVSNPPYIGANEPELRSPALQREPRAALSPGEDGMASLRAIIRDAPPHLEHGGWLLLEHGSTQAAEVARKLVARGFRHVRSHRDLGGHERMTEAQWG